MGIAELRAAERSRFHSARQSVAQPQPGMGGRWPAVERSAPAGWPYGAKPAPTPILKGCGGIEESVQRSKRRGEKKKYRIVNIQQTFLQRMLLCLNIPATMPSASAGEGCTKP